MTIPSVRGGSPAPAFLPLRRAESSGFADALRAQVRAEAAEAISARVAEPLQAAKQAGRASALQQSLLSRRGATLNLSTTGEWADLARSIGRQYLAPDVAEVFVRQMALESGNFDPDVIAGRRVSSAGAEGIAQLMPSSYPNINRLDPVASLNAAAATMRGNLQSFGGDLGKALAAYNAGAGRVNTDVARYGAAWQSGLPAETQTYLRELLGGAYA